MINRDSDCFCETWESAHAVFRDKVLALGGAYDELPLDQVSPGGVPLSIGIGLLSFRNGKVIGEPDLAPENLVIHLTGVHGVEGFAGSAAQIHWLQRLSSSPGINSARHAADHSVLLIHCVNAWGMSWLRRFNGNNVDLNRNAIDETEALPSSDNYLSVDRVLMDQSWHRHFWLPRLAAIALRKGSKFLTQALTGGQYVKPKGFWYGGNHWEPELRVISAYLRSKFPAVSRVFAIDIHTGLGSFGSESLFTHDRVLPHEVEEVTGKIGRKISYDEVDGQPSYHATGGFAGVIYSAFPKAKVNYVLQEFGTFSGIRIIRGLYHEHHRWLSGTFGPGVRESENLKHLFCPPDHAWRHRILDKSLELLGQVQRSGFL